MPNLIVKPVANRRERKQFLELSWEINRHDPNWMPPLRRNQEELVGFRPHPFYHDAESQTFRALCDGQPVGRIAAIVNHAHNRCHQESRGFFGFFECVDDQETAAELFDAARAWLGAKGMSAIRGPTNPSMNYECGLLIEGFETPPYFMMTHNLPYYQGLIEGCGFQKAEDMFAFRAPTNMVTSLDQKRRFIAQEATKRFNLRLRRMERWHFQRDVKIFLDMYNQALSGTWGFVPLSDAEVRHMSGVMKHLIVPEMTAIIEIDGQPIGAQLGLLDYNPRIKQIDGRLFPFGFVRLLWNKKAIKRVRIVSTNVVPEFQKWGLGIVLGAKMLPDAIAWGMEEGEFSWVLESNRLSFGTLQRGGAKITKRYRLFDGAIPQAATPRPND